MHSWRRTRTCGSVSRPRRRLRFRVGFFHFGGKKGFMSGGFGRDLCGLGSRVFWMMRKKQGEPQNPKDKADI